MVHNGARICLMQFSGPVFEYLQHALCLNILPARGKLVQCDGIMHLAEWIY